MFWPTEGFPGGTSGKKKNKTHQPLPEIGDVGLDPGSGRSPGRQGNPFQQSCLENPMDRGAWQATVHGVTKSLTRLSDFTFTTFRSIPTFSHSAVRKRSKPCRLHFLDFTLYWLLVRFGAWKLLAENWRPVVTENLWLVLQPDSGGQRNLACFSLTHGVTESDTT